MFFHKFYQKFTKISGIFGQFGNYVLRITNIFGFLALANWLDCAVGAAFFVVRIEDRRGTVLR